jgi:hypothetical protein
MKLSNRRLKKVKAKFRDGRHVSNPELCILNLHFRRKQRIEKSVIALSTALYGSMQMAMIAATPPFDKSLIPSKELSITNLCMDTQKAISKVYDEKFKPLPRKAYYELYNDNHLNVGSYCNNDLPILKPLQCYPLPQYPLGGLIVNTGRKSVDPDTGEEVCDFGAIKHSMSMGMLKKEDFINPDPQA